MKHRADQADAGARLRYPGIVKLKLANLASKI